MNGIINGKTRLTMTNHVERLHREIELDKKKLDIAKAKRRQLLALARKAGDDAKALRREIKNNRRLMAVARKMDIAGQALRELQ